MDSKHISFIVEQAYGHIIPTIGIAMELIRRGHRVSYATTADFMPIAARSGAQVAVIDPIKTRERIFNLLFQETSGGAYDSIGVSPEVIQNFQKIRTERSWHSLAPLEKCYETDRPDLIVHDDAEGTSRCAIDACKFPMIAISPPH